jgi:hypothetical protein
MCLLKDHSKTCKCHLTTKFKEKKTICFVCKKSVDKVLDLCATSKDLCSIECERTFWLDILY